MGSHWGFRGGSFSLMQNRNFRFSCIKTPRFSGSDGYDEHWVDLATSASIAKASSYLMPPKLHTEFGMNKGN